MTDEESREPCSEHYERCDLRAHAKQYAVNACTRLGVKNDGIFVRGGERGFSPSELETAYRDGYQLGRDESLRQIANDCRWDVNSLCVAIPFRRFKEVGPNDDYELYLLGRFLNLIPERKADD